MAEQIYIKRVRFTKGGQGKFLKEAIDKIGKPTIEIAKLCSVHPRTLYDWRREKYQITYGALKEIAKYAKVKIPRNINILPTYWYVKKGAKLGGINRNKIHGNPGTLEGRKKGGIVTVAKFKQNPSYAKKLGFKLRKEIHYPGKSSLLAEFIGIILGDGCISDNIVKVSLNSATDQKYAVYITNLVKELFAIKCSFRYEKRNALEIIICSRNLIDFLIECGLKKGNKVRNQIDIPDWIFRKKAFIKACLRGLVDTDGGIYYHNHITKGIKYRNIGLCFTNKSLSLLNSAHRMLLNLGISAKNDKKSHVAIYGLNAVNQYMALVGSSNSKHIEKLKLYRGPKV